MKFNEQALRGGGGRFLEYDGVQTVLGSELRRCLWVDFERGLPSEAVEFQTPSKN